jgi:hypothetical protein
MCSEANQWLTHQPYENPMTNQIIFLSQLAMLAACGNESLTPININNSVDNSILIEDGCCGCEDEDPCSEEEEEEVVSAESCECPEGFAATPDGDACVQTTEFEAEFTGIEYEVCEGDEIEVYSIYGALLPDGNTEQNSFWGENNAVNDGRLIDVGVWTCDTGDYDGSTIPVGEWIGFSTCIDIEKPGSYLVGIAADNRIKFSVDGVLTFERDNNDVENFKYWNVIRVDLSSGTHNIEMMGYNDGAWAAFGAEIYGPFTEAEVATDAAISAIGINEEHVVWSTGEQLGTTFDIGEESGWTCPDGTAFDACAAEPTCTERLEEDCI